jgi:hypothetical protein
LARELAEPPLLLRNSNQGDWDMTEFRDVYSKITDCIIADLEQGVRPWMKPWNADHAAGRITQPYARGATAFVVVQNIPTTIERAHADRDLTLAFMAGEVPMSETIPSGETIR